MSKTEYFDSLPVLQALGEYAKEHDGRFYLYGLNEDLEIEPPANVAPLPIVVSDFGDEKKDLKAMLVAIGLFARHHQEINAVAASRSTEDFMQGVRAGWLPINEGDPELILRAQAYKSFVEVSDAVEVLRANITALTNRERALMLGVSSALRSAQDETGEFVARLWHAPSRAKLEHLDRVVQRLRQEEIPFAHKTVLRGA